MCEAHWLATGVPVDSVEQMRDELHQHLWEAAHEGKPVEAVIGGDVLSFAEEWAAQTRAPTSLKWRVLGWTRVISGYTLLLLLVGHLLDWSLTFSTPPITYLYGFVAISLSLVWFHSMPLAAPLHLEGSPLQQIAFCVGAALCTMGILVAINLLTGFGDPAPLSDWSWTGTLVVLVISLIPGKPRQNSGALPARPDQETTF